MGEAGSRGRRSDSPLDSDGRPATGFVVAVAVAVMFAGALVALVIAAL